MEENIEHTTTLYAEPVAHLGPLLITNALITSWAAVLIIILFVFVLRKSLREVPRGIQNFFEAILEGALSLCDQVTGSRKISNAVFPLGGFGVIERSGEGLSFVPFLRSGTADINTTLGLSLMSVIGANLFGIFSIGAWRAFNKFINLRALGQIFSKVRHDPAILVVAPVTFFVGILELIGELAKVASLSFRLFGNIF